mmetsp:Transcript_3940/g.5948  ORF Transcript_3940/g.5948 Transcript_3940/m.5948 type:complete len:97 (+) Transcript_3940:194-484(+)
MRTVQRFVWFLDFVAAFLKIFSTQRDQPIADCAKEAYKQTLAHRHGWFVRNISNFAMNFLNSRKEFITSLISEQSKVLDRPYKEDECLRDLLRLSD